MNRIMGCYFDIISGKRRGFLSFFVRIALFLFSLLYNLIIEIRNFFYKTGVFKTNSLSVPVISVGNITLGGTGKTPLVIWLAEWLNGENFKVGILTRGYGRKDNNIPVILSEKNGISDYNITGDEPLLIKNRIAEDIPVIVGSDRLKTGLILKEKFNTGLVILDDGFQHIALKRDLDIVVIDAFNPFGNYSVFPAGILREKISNLKRADIFLITKVDLIPEAGKNKILSFIKNIIPDAVILEGIFKPDKFVSLKTGKAYPIEYVFQKKCIAFSGIGNPDSFDNTLKNINLLVSNHIVFPDHYPFQEKDILEIIKEKRARNSDLIITTEKDAIRLKNLSPKIFEEDILYLSIKLQIAGEEIIKERIRKLLK